MFNFFQRKDDPTSLWSHFNVLADRFRNYVIDTDGRLNALENKENDKSSLSIAIIILTEALKKDKEYYYAWQANIAMAFQDEYIRHKKKDIHKISNIAAKNFLNLLMRRNEDNE